MRLTLDIDGDDDRTRNKVIEIHRLLKKKFDKHDMELYKTRRGYHLIVYDTELSFSEVIRLRELLGDDKNRIKLDEELIKKPKQVLFTKKDGHQRTLIPWDWVKT